MGQKIIITNAKCLENLSVELHFNDNSVSVVDIGNFILKHPHPQYNKYLKPVNLRKFSIENGNIVWGKNWDLSFPIEQLYSGF